MENMLSAAMVILEQRLKIQVAYRRASTAHNGGDADPHQATHIMTSQRGMDALRETRGGYAQMFMFGLPVFLDVLMHEATYRIEPAER